MPYEVEIAESAAADLEEAFQWIRRRSPRSAERWRSELLERAVTLEDFPERCPLAPENENCRREIRQLIHGNYRLLFTVIGSHVYVLHVRHGARMPIQPKAMDEPE